MTLHWWMHWFWVTSLLTLLAYCDVAIAAPQLEEPQQFTADIEDGHRQGRAMYPHKTSVYTTKRPNSTNVTATMTMKVTNKNGTQLALNSSKAIHDLPSSVTWTPINTTAPITVSTITKYSPNIDQNYNGSAPNVTVTPNVTDNIINNITNIDESDDNIDPEGALENRIVTEKPLSLETALLETRIPPNVESSKRVVDPTEGRLDTGAIAGISFAALVLGALAGSTAFVLYRRRYLNKPQTLNDKCSNPDSSGYLDDSTVRDNSEEMYSLDNDSFLNSLEAMTIQNYWTDTVKHTKL